MPTLSQLQAKIIVDGVTDAVRGLQQVAAGFDDAGGKAKQAKPAADSYLESLLKFQGIRIAADALLGFGQAALGSYASNERLGQSLQALIAKEELHAGRAKDMTQALQGAGEKSQKLLQWTQQLAIESPFTQDGVAQAFKMAQAYGFVSDSADRNVVSAKRLTQAMIDFSSGSGQSEESMSRIALALGQIQAKGKLAGQEVLQLTNVGLNVDQMLASAFGKSTAEIVKMREQGMIPANQAILAIVQSLEHDFGGAAKRQAGTMSGLLNSLSDLKDVGLREFFTGTFQAIQPYAQKFVDTLSDPGTQAQIRQLGDSVGKLASEALPPLVDAIGGAAQGITAFGQSAGPVVAFLKDNGLPIISGVAVALTVQLIPALATTATSLTATLVAAGPVGLALAAIGVAIANVTKAYLELDAAEQTVATQVEQSHQWWADSAKALDDYAKASAPAKQGSVDQAEALKALRAEQNAAIKALVDHQAKGKSNYETSAHWTAGIQAEKDAINARSQAITQATADLEQHIQLYGEIDGRRESIEAMRSAHQGDAQAIAQSVDQLEKLKKSLESARESASKAYQSLKQAASDYQDESQKRADAHAKKLIDIDAAQNKQLLDASAKYTKDKQVAETNLDESIDRIRTTLYRKLADDEQQFQRAEQERQQEYADRRAQLEADLTDQIAGVRAASAQRIGEIQQRADEQQTQDAQQYLDRQQALNQQGIDAQTAYRQRLVDIATQYQRRLADMRQQEQYRLEDAEISQQYASEDRAQAHLDRMQDIRDQAANAAQAAQTILGRTTTLTGETWTTAIQTDPGGTSNGVEAQLAAEEAQFQKAEERTKRNEATQAARQAAQVERQRQRQIAAMDQQRALDEADAAQRLVDQQTALAKEDAALQQSYAKQQADRAAQLAQQIADERASEVAHEQTAVAAAAKKDAQLTADFEKETAKRQQHYDEQRAQTIADAQRQANDAAAAYAKQLVKLDESLNEQVARIKQGHDDQIAQENGSFAAQEAERANAYAKQKAHLETALGEQLNAYIDVQQKLGFITEAEAKRRHEVVAYYYGETLKKEREAYDAYFGDLTATTQAAPTANTDQYGRRTTTGAPGRASGGPVEAGQAYIVGEKRPELFIPRTDGVIQPYVGGGGSNPTLNITINVQGGTNPEATARAVREEFIRAVRATGGSVSSFFGGTT